MRSSFTFLVCLLGLALVFLGNAVWAEDKPGGKDLLQQVRAAWRKGDKDKAFQLINEGIEREPKHIDYYLLRSSLYENREQFDRAIADLDIILKLDPKQAVAYNRRGAVQFKRGRIAESVADFDRYIELEPQARPGHWQRGISLYYAGRYDEGRKQFEAYETKDTNDVENAVWHFICNARVVGMEKARGAILKIGKDKRVPLMEVYDFYRGKCKPEDVLAAAKGGDVNEEQRKRQLFYAHLYLGIYYDVSGDKKAALEHLTLAADKYRIGHYMGDVAHVHAELLRKESEQK